MGESVDLLARLVPTLAVIVGALLLVRRWAQRGSGGTGAGIRVLARAGLSRGAVVAVVEVGAQRYLVGASEQGVSLLSELSADALPADALPADALSADTLPADALPADALHDKVMGPAAKDVPRLVSDRPGMGPIDRLRAMTVRTHLERPIRAQGG